LDSVRPCESPAAAVDPAARWRSIAAAIGCISIVGFALALTIPLLSLMLEARGISDTWIGLNTAVAGLGALVTAAVVPRLVGRFGTVRLLYAAVIAGAVALLLLPPSPFWAWFPIRFVLTGAITVLFVVSEFWINATAPDGKRGLVMGIYASVLSAGFAAGPAVLAIFGSASPIPLAVATISFVLAAIPVALAGNVVPKVEGRSKLPMISLVFVAPAAILAALVFGAGESTTLAFIALWGQRSGFAEAEAALLLTMAGLGNLLFQVPIGMLADRANRSMVLTLCGAIASVGAGLLPMASDSVTLAFAIIFVWGGVAAGLYTVGLTQLGARFTGAELASANALFVMLYSVGMLIGPAMGGAAMDAWPPDGLPLALALLFGAYTLIAGGRWITSR